ncbi:TPA: hypothetical protein U1B28_000384 [Streptococcus suis]|uniref:alpha/beta hydrolase n=1 Tax=Streptococcus suis TaxID=1307 RepID=UPI00209B90D2|nr:alpha/beta hydrolase-fold protein [Streptococcus suis]MCO8174375.1 alpha/beta hydrolase-fold protein [Streptococcus suis]MCO8208775.1 alpha/beta hydrolase-fold protein [Streptococcus suis]HEM3488804.1 hypothetical protein [Streptococcus suis]
MTFPDLKTIPEHYLLHCKNAGTLEILSYDTYEAFSYGSDHPIPLKKEAIIYLPYGYTSSKKYPIVYLSHGGWSNERTTMGSPSALRPFKHILDHAIANGEVVPMIVVNLTYNNTSSQDSSDFGLAIQLTSRYYQELTQDLIPAVEKKYSTYATSTSPEELIGSRRYRAFSGFSMGSVNTWRTFENALDYFYYFNPMSGNVGTPARVFAKIAEQKQQDFLIYAVSGTDDFAYRAFKQQVLSLSSRAPRIFKQEENIIFRERNGGRHDYRAVCEYTYNALVNFSKVVPQTIIKDAK